MLCYHDDGELRMKCLPEGRIKELDILMFPGYFKDDNFL